MKRMQIPQRLVQKILRTRNCHRKFIKNLLTEKRKENLQTRKRVNQTTSI